MNINHRNISRNNLLVKFLILYVASFPVIQMDCHSMYHPPYFLLFQDDDGFILYESRAICYYIAAKYPNQGTPLLPTELKANALFHQAASVETYHFTNNVLNAAEEMYKKP